MGVKVREKVPGSGVWWIIIHHKRRRKKIKIGNKEMAERVATRIREALFHGIYKWSEPQSFLFLGYSKNWLENQIKPLRSASTYEKYRPALERLIWPAFGSKRIEEIKRGDVRNLILKNHRAGASRSKLCLIRDIVSSVMSCAVDDEIIEVNPASGIIKSLRLDRSRKAEVNPYNAKEVDLILRAAWECYPRYYTFLMCAFRTGMRLGEICGVQWSDVDWHGRFIEVRRSVRRGLVTKTKTGKTRRVDMSGELAGSLKQLHAQRKTEALEAGTNEAIKWIFHHDGKPLHQNTVRHAWRRTVGKAGLRYEKFHAIRHTYASLLLSAGVSLAYVKEQLGHHSIDMTVDIYGHWIPSGEKEVDRLDRKRSLKLAEKEE